MGCQCGLFPAPTVAQARHWRGEGAGSQFHLARGRGSPQEYVRFDLLSGEHIGMKRLPPGAGVSLTVREAVGAFLR